jgi:hypothetical protein
VVHYKTVVKNEKEGYIDPKSLNWVHCLIISCKLGKLYLPDIQKDHNSGTHDYEYIRFLEKARAL